MPSLSQRLQDAVPNAANRGGCHSCKWWGKIGDETRTLINEWIDAGHSLKQLYEILSASSDDSSEPPLPVSVTGWRLHMAHHDEKCRG